tara:strand:- start:2881 stop:3141 length:261 start_codon:yes stop_codon:yes gene_type:complete
MEVTTSLTKIKKMKLTIDLKYALLAIVSFTISVMTLTGTADKYIAFAGELNAFAFCVMGLMLGLLMTMAAVEKVTVGKYTLIGKSK